MIDKSWIKKINEIKQICTDLGMPIDIGEDKNPYGIDGQMELGDITFTADGNLNYMNMDLIIQYSIDKKDWAILLEKLMILSQKLGENRYFLFTGWTKEPDDTKLIYNGTINLKGIMNKDLLSECT